MKIPFNKPYITGDELSYIKDVFSKVKLSGNGEYTKKCQNFFQEKYGFKKCLLTSSCTDALEMAAILSNIKEGDEVIMPSYTFVSTSNAFVLRGAKIIFVDSRDDHPGLNEMQIEHLITKKTKAIVPVHYAGVACDMEKIMELASKYNLLVIEDAAQAVDSYYTFKNGTKKALGSIGHFSTFSFHETKNIISGEGGMLVINDERFAERSEIIWEKGTNRSAFFRGEVNKYGWVDIGSSFLTSEITAAFLWGQIQNIDDIQSKRKEIWTFYYNELKEWAFKNDVKLPTVPHYAENNAHMFYLVCKKSNQRKKIIDVLKKSNILSVFHYLSLHKSTYYNKKHDGRDLLMSDKFSDCLIRLPLYYELTEDNLHEIISLIKSTEF